MEAGVNELFEPFGEFGTMYGLADGDPTKFDTVITMDYNTIFNTLRYRIAQAKFQRRLQKAYQRKA